MLKCQCRLVQIGDVIACLLKLVQVFDTQLLQISNAGLCQRKLLQVFQAQVVQSVNFRLLCEH